MLLQCQPYRVQYSAVSQLWLCVPFAVTCSSPQPVALRALENRRVDFHEILCLQDLVQFIEIFQILGSDEIKGKRTCFCVHFETNTLHFFYD